MPGVNPLVAGAADAPVSPWAGVWIAEDLEAVLAGVRSGSWIDTTIGAVSAGLDALAFLTDPVGGLLQYGVAWIIEHVKPLSEALDWLAGDPAEIAAHARTWHTAAAALRDRAADLDRAVRWDTGDWTGRAADAYRVRAGQHRDALGGLAVAAETMAAMTEGAGMLIAGVRVMVRDAIAVVVSRLITYAAEEVFSLGLATPLVIGQVSTLCAAWAARIATWLRGLLGSLGRLRGMGGQVAEAVEALKKLLNRRREAGAPGGTTPSGRPDPGRKPRGRRTDAHPQSKKDRPLRRENETADTLAAHGYDVEQNPPPKPNGKEPDYRIEGEYFDCYSPSSRNLDNIRDEVSGKVKEGQADRIVLNLDDCPRSVDELKAVLERKPITNLAQILVVKDGQVTPFYPFT
jgi:hypothetical protein